MRRLFDEGSSYLARAARKRSVRVDTATTSRMSRKRPADPGFAAPGPAQKKFAEIPAEYEGKVASRGRRYGFIQCEATFALYGKDVYSPLLFLTPS